MESARPRAYFLCAVTAAALAGCGGGGGGGSSSVGFPGQLLTKPGGGSFFVDANHGGGATRLHLVESFWGRLVDVHDVDSQGRVNLEPVFRDFTINENVQTDANNYRLETNPITQRTRLVVRRERNAPDTGTGDFESLVRAAAQGLPPIVPKNDDGTSSEPFSFVSRNGTLVLRFDDVLQDDVTAQQDLFETVRIRAGYPPETPFLGRVLFDPNYGALVGGDFHSTRVLVDFTISADEAASMPVPQPINAVGLPASVDTIPGPDVSLRIPTRTDPGAGQFKLLRSLSGVPLSSSENGPVDESIGTVDVVRAMRSGNPADLNNGFLLDLNSPEVLGSWSMVVNNATNDPAGQAGFDFLIDATFTTICRGAPSAGDVISVGGVSLEVEQDSGPPDVGGFVPQIHARSLGADPLPTAGLIGNASFLSTFDPAESVPAGCWIDFTPLPTELPATGVATSSVARVRFSEPMDPLSISPFDNFFLVRGDSNTVVIPTNLIVGEITPTLDLKEFVFAPVLPLPHDTATRETYHARVVGATDLAGNTLKNSLPPINFTMEPSDAAVSNGGTVLNFNGTDELEPIGAPDVRGQFFLDLDRGLIRPRPVTYTSYPVDRINPVPSIMIPFPRGVQTPLVPLGSKLQAVWRYCDLGWQVQDETKYNLDVFGLSWAPIGGTVVSDFFDGFAILLSHARRLPDEAIDANLLPKYVNSGVQGAPSKFEDNVLKDPLSPQATVHPRLLGYRISSADLFRASSGTTMLPYPLNRNPLIPPVTYTWRDTAVLSLGGPQGAGIPLDIEAGGPLNIEDFSSWVADTGKVPSFGLPLLMEYRCYPTDTGVGLNALDISLAINSSAQPSFRTFSTGGINNNGVAVQRNPDTELVPSGAFNPTSTPPGNPTPSDDNGFYIGQLDAVTRVSRVHTIWIDSHFGAPDYAAPVILPPASSQPDGTSVVVEYRGVDTGGFVFDEAGTDPSLLTYPFNAQRLNPYGEIFKTKDINGVSTIVLFPSVEFPGTLSFHDGVSTWSSNIDSVDGAQFIQLRITFLNNIVTRLNPELSGIGLAYSNP